jgi:hypothetical protein
MIWLYQRDDEVLQLETRFDKETNEFVLVQHQPGGTQATERFGTEDQFRLRLTALSAALNEQQWLQKGPPLLLNDGWKI